ncbi:MAG: hypothetical protein ACE3JK_07955 [Sporolactobacillus sp.]
MIKIVSIQTIAILCEKRVIDRLDVMNAYLKKIWVVATSPVKNTGRFSKKRRMRFFASTPFSIEGG